MRALSIREPPLAELVETLLRLRRLGSCGTGPSKFTGKDPIVAHPGIPGARDGSHGLLLLDQRGGAMADFSVVPCGKLPADLDR